MYLYIKLLRYFKQLCKNMKRGKKMVQKKEKNNLRSSLLLLVLAVTLLISSSYAWFTSNQTVTVSSLNVNVEAKNGLQISTDGTSWKSIIQNTDITTANATYPTSVNQVPTVLEPISTSGNVTDAKLDMFYGVVGTNTDGDYILSTLKQTDVEGNGVDAGRYIAFDLFFKVEKDTPVYISTNSGVKSKEGVASRGLENAARIAFIDQGNTSAGSAIATIQGLNNGNTASTKIWELNYDVHTAAAVANAYDTYGQTTTTTGGTRLPYYGVKAEMAETDNILLKNAKDTNFFEEVTPTISTVSGFATNQSLTTLKAGITKMRIYMYVEGQDVDCENNASGADITFDLQVTTNI